MRKKLTQSGVVKAKMREHANSEFPDLRLRNPSSISLSFSYRKSFPCTYLQKRHFRALSKECRLLLDTLQVLLD